MSQAATVSTVSRSPGYLLTIALVFLASLLAVTLGPVWLSVVPDWLVFPISDIVGSSITWFAREASIGGLAVQEITRLFAELVDKPIEGAVVVLADGLFSGRGLNVTRSVPPISWLALGGATVIIAYRFGGRRLALTTVVCVGFLVLFDLWHNAMVTLSNVLVSVFLAAAIGLALGVWSHRSAHVENVTRGVMNVMQTVPIFFLFGAYAFTVRIRPERRAGRHGRIRTAADGA